MTSFGKTLDEMTTRERTDLIQLVAGALLASSESAEEAGDVQHARNSRCVACTLMGCWAELPDDQTDAVKVLLEQGMTLMNANALRTGSKEIKH